MNDWERVLSCFLAGVLFGVVAYLIVGRKHER
jgi:hypothetical protein